MVAYLCPTVIIASHWSQHINWSLVIVLTLSLSYYIVNFAFGLSELSTRTRLYIRRVTGGLNPSHNSVLAGIDCTTTRLNGGLCLVWLVSWRQTVFVFFASSAMSPTHKYASVSMLGMHCHWSPVGEGSVCVCATLRLNAHQHISMFTWWHYYLPPPPPPPPHHHHHHQQHNTLPFSRRIQQRAALLLILAQPLSMCCLLCRGDNVVDGGGGGSYQQRHSDWIRFNFVLQQTLISTTKCH